MHDCTWSVSSENLSDFSKEIKNLIQDSLEKVHDGTELVNNSGHALEAIVGSVRKVSDIVGEISGASVEQSQGIEEIHRAINLMDQRTQQNAAMVEECTAAAHSFDAHARELRVSMKRFRLATGARKPEARPLTTAQASTPCSQEAQTKEREANAATNGALAFRDF